MKMEDFVSLVREMRTAQKAWFLNKQSSDLTRAKRLEKEVDEAVVHITDGGQPEEKGLFGQEAT